MIKKKKRNILAIDPSIRGTGLVVMNEKGKILYNEKLEYRERKQPVYYLGDKTFDKTKELVVENPILRGEVAADRILKIIKKFKVNEVAMEDYSFGSKSVGMLFNIGEFVGMLKLKLYKAGINIRFIPPTSLKLYITGLGNAKKEVILANIIKKYNIDLGDEDLNDAYALAKMTQELGSKLEEFCTKKGMLGLKKKLRAS